MSMEEFKQEGLLLPEEKWGKLDLHTSVNKTALVLTFGLAFVAAALMIAGQGTWLTWVGAFLFVIFMLAFTLVSNAGIERQSERLRKVVDRSGEPGH